MKNKQMVVTYVCCYNNTNTLNNMLLCALTNNKDKSIEREILLIDNTKGKYPSCAAAYNHELHQGGCGSILIFLHQDIAFDDFQFEKRIVKELTENPNQILGFAGMPAKGGVVSNLRYYRTKEFITKRQIKDKTECMAVDECCFAMTANLYRRLGFDEQVCFHWHLHATEICYNAYSQYGTKTYVLPEEIYHKLSDGGGLQCDWYYLRTLWRLAAKYRASFQEIRTPCYIASTNPFALSLKISRTAVKNLLLRFMP